LINWSEAELTNSSERGQAFVTKNRTLKYLGMPYCIENYPFEKQYVKKDVIVIYFRVFLMLSQQILSKRENSRREIKRRETKRVFLVGLICRLA